MTIYTCPYCHAPLTDADVTRDGEALRCAECGERVEYFDALEAGSTTKVLCTGFPACGFRDCPHATAHDPYTFGGSDGDGVTCETEGPCAQWQQRVGIGVKKSRCRCVAVSK